MFITSQNDFFDYMRTSASGNAESAPLENDSEWLLVNNGDQCYLFIDNATATTGTVDLDFYVKVRTKLVDDTYAYKVIKFGTANDLGVRSVAVVSFAGTLRGGRFWLKPIISTSTDTEPFDIYYLVV